MFTCRIWVVILWRGLEGSKHMDHLRTCGGDLIVIPWNRGSSHIENKR